MKKESNNLNRKEFFRFLRKNTPFYLTGLILIFLTKYFYSRAGAAQLLWLLAPTAGWVSILTGLPFEWIQDVGYVNHEMKIIIAPSCSGMQFMLIAAAMLVFSFVHLAADGLPCRRKTAADAPEPASGQKEPLPLSGGTFLRKGFTWIGVCIVLSYLFTVSVNSLRIIAAIYVPLLFDGLRLFGDFLTPDSLHTVIGTVVYFAALLALYRLTGACFHRRTENTIVHKCLPPVFWYFFIVLGIPFLNQACARNGAKFTEFAVLVTLCCGGILLLYFTGALLWKRHSSLRPKCDPRHPIQ